MGCSLKSEKELKKEGRGGMDMKVIKKADVVLVGAGEVGVAKSWSVAAKERIDILCPEVILYYSQFMGVVDKLDFVMTLSPMRVKTRKWTVRVLSHFVSLALANLWLEYVRDVSNKGLTRSKTHDMMSFQIEVALSLIKQNQEVQKK
ncbi:piggyBac transposable element-derived protein 3-like [Ixodes scapularis]|uniref:piggyBac transposable element-derived protein 3-like n=1 Tax=Ixodes scapularis TaxID=6945 RepID=UPI001A9E312D|nr:piggyBac transposable element-derived protein 3-like [Ixodes scapularis]